MGVDITVQNLCKSFGSLQVLQNYSGIFRAGQVSCITGSSGGGKTTLLRLLMGLEKPDSGTITGLENAVCSAVFQEDRLCENLSVLSNLRLVCSSKPSKEMLIGELAKVDLLECVDKPVRELSGGMKRRVSIVRAMLPDFSVLFLDEPFKGLDADTYTRVTDYVREKTQGKTVIMVSHDPRDIAQLNGVEFPLPMMK